MSGPLVAVYLGTNMVIDLSEVFIGWRPPSDSGKTAKQKVAAARLFFYGVHERGWDLVISAEGRAELIAREAPDWAQTVFHARRAA